MKFITSFLLSTIAVTGIAFAQTTTPSPTAAPANTGTNIGQDVSALRKDVEEKIMALKKEMEEKIKAIRDEYKTKIEALRKDAQDKMQTVKDAMKKQREEARDKQKAMRDEMKQKRMQKGSGTPPSTTPAPTSKPAQ